MDVEIAVWDSNVLIPLILPRSKSSFLYSRLDNAGWFIATTPTMGTTRIRWM
jgi:hypothetical protein